MRRHLHSNMLILTALAFLLLIATACGSDGAQRSAADLDKQSREWLDVSSHLQTTNRSALSVCLDGAEGYDVTSDDLDAVALALEDAIARTVDPPAEYAKRIVVEGCPEPRAPSYVVSTIGGDRLDENDWNIGRVIIGHPGAPPEPSLHRLFVYLVPPDVYSGYFKAEPYFRHTAESLRFGDEFVGVTSAVYLRSSASHEDFRAALTRLLNLAEFTSDPSVDEEYRRNCELGTPELWCGPILESALAADAEQACGEVASRSYDGCIEAVLTSAATSQGDLLCVNDDGEWYIQESDLPDDENEEGIIVFVVGDSCERPSYSIVAALGNGKILP